MKFSHPAIAVLAASAIPTTTAISLNVSDPVSVQSAASSVAYGLMKYYTGNITNTESTIAVLPQPYYWWEAGALWGAMLDYYHYTGDTSYNEVTSQALLSQVGPKYDFMVPLHVKDEGNDDQAFWGFAAMAAAEMDFPQPTTGPYSWVELTENLWNTQAQRWDTATCGGGLKWQIFTFNNGYDYKNSVSNGAFFQLSARLARFTGNQTYVDWAEKVFEWSTTIGLVSDTYRVYDGSDDNLNCTSLNHITWTYSSGIYMYGAAVMYNYTNGSDIWSERTQGFLNATIDFFSPFDNSTNIMYEQACETVNTCNNDQYSFKAYLARFMWKSTLMASFTTSAITTFLTTSAEAAAQACSGPANGFSIDGQTCGQKWYVGGYDGSVGVGQQLSALEAIHGLLINSSTAPLHANQVHLIAPAATSTAPLPSKTAATTTAKTVL
ncbi:mannan endo-1,6-alpha-mannosidase-1 [Coleophoma crateriformis]|uniref:Mannan endo-1,6-alpha-mannosidase n=1 Tax=Coleophoma crateriformis TaxID=565419 RepID=A0A3D8SXL8_9HELO|nr:mannan endo-1,6-alpha-mannosidase-1 [Coleophoma crateriformis]